MKIRALLIALLLASAPACKNSNDASAPPVTVANQNVIPTKNSPNVPAASEQPAPQPSSDQPEDGELGPGTPEQETLLIQAKTAFLADDFEVAEGFFRHLANSEPISGPTVTAALALGQIYIDTDRKDEALTLYKSLAERVPDIAEVQLVVARAYAGTGETTAAIRAFQKTLELQPNFVFVHTELGNLYVKAGRNDDAGAAFLKYEQRIYAMAKALENPETPDEQRLQIVENFGLITDDRATQAIVTALTDPHPQIRLSAAATLGELNVTAALERLEQMAIEDPDMQVRMTARASANALKNAPPDPEATLAPIRVDSPDQLPSSAP